MFEISGGNRIPAVAYKVNPDGTIANIVNLRASDNNIRLTMNGLKSGTVYEADIEVIREIGGTAETVSVLHVSFTTAWATGIGYTGETTFSVYPNPFAGYIVVDATESGTVSICDLSGKVILTANVNPGVNRINTSALSKGVYVLRTGSYTVKIVK